MVEAAARAIRAAFIGAEAFKRKAFRPRPWGALPPIIVERYRQQAIEALVAALTVHNNSRQQHRRGRFQEKPPDTAPSPTERIEPDRDQ